MASGGCKECSYLGGQAMMPKARCTGDYTRMSMMPYGVIGR